MPGFCKEHFEMETTQCETSETLLIAGPWAYHRSATCYSDGDKIPFPHGACHDPIRIMLWSERRTFGVGHILPWLWRIAPTAAAPPACAGGAGCAHCWAVFHDLLCAHWGLWWGHGFLTQLTSDGFKIFFPVGLWPDWKGGKQQVVPFVFLLCFVSDTHLEANIYSSYSKVLKFT